MAAHLDRKVQPSGQAPPPESPPDTTEAPSPHRAVVKLPESPARSERMRRARKAKKAVKDEPALIGKKKDRFRTATGEDALKVAQIEMKFTKPNRKRDEDKGYLVSKLVAFWERATWRKKKMTV